MRRLTALTSIFFFMIFTGCGGSTSDSITPPTSPPPPVVEKRSFYMGFTPWLYEASLAAISTTYSRISTHGDMIKHHIQGGIPWQEALDGTAYHANVEAELSGRIDNTAAGTQIFLAIDSLNSARDALSPNWGESDNQPLSGDWASRTWSSPEVIAAYINFASDMIDRFQPTYFDYATEISELILNNPSGYSDFIIFAQAVHSSLSSLYPNLKLMTSVALKSPNSNEMQLIEASYGQIMPYTDVLGVSVYPYAFFNHSDRGDPTNMPSNWLSQITSIAGNKPLAITETGWIAEDLEIIDFQYSEQSDQTKQNAYATKMLQAAVDLDMEFVIWWTTTDFDTLWNNELAQDPIAKIWKDIGLYDENQNMRSALQTWDEWLAKQLE